MRPVQALQPCRNMPACFPACPGTPLEIRTGAEGGSEMGVFHSLFLPQREENLRVSLQEYLRFGLDAGLFFVT